MNTNIFFVSTDYKKIFKNILYIDESLKAILNYAADTKEMTIEEKRLFWLSLNRSNAECSAFVQYYSKLAIKLAYDFCIKYDTNIADTVQCALEELSRICVEDSNISSVYNHIYSKIKRYLERKLPNLLNISFSHIPKKVLVKHLSTLQNPKILFDRSDEDSELESLINDKKQIKSDIMFVDVKNIDYILGTEEELRYMLIESNPTENQVENKCLKEQIFDILETIPKKEAFILYLRFGFSSIELPDYLKRYYLQRMLQIDIFEQHLKILSVDFEEKCHTYEEIGQVLNENRTIIRQLEARALRKLRHPSRSRRIKDFL